MTLADPGRRSSWRSRFSPPLAGLHRASRRCSGCSGPSPISSPSSTASQQPVHRARRGGAAPSSGWSSASPCSPRSSASRRNGSAMMYDVDAVRRDFPILVARGARPAAGLSRQRRLGAEAAGGDRRGDPGLFAWNTPTSTAACTTSRTSRPRSTRRRAASCAASSARATRRRSSSPPARPWGSTSSATPGPRRASSPATRSCSRVMEHHANIVPWHFLRERQGVVLKWVDIEPDGSLDPQKVIDADRAAHEARRGHPHVERARHRRRREGDLRRRRARGACRCWSTAARRRCTCRSTSQRPRLRLLRDHRPQALRPDRLGRALRPARAARARCGPSSAAAT